MTSSVAAGDEVRTLQPVTNNEGRVADQKKIRVGAERTEIYLPMLAGKKVGIVTNHTGVVDEKTHLVDTLLTCGVDIKMVFAPEHGFRGDADAGTTINSYTDPKTGLKVISLYGANKKPNNNNIKELDIVIFDIQDVGLRFYTYLSTMHYVMEACAQNDIPMIVLDRPNPNGFYVDGPILDTKYRSFVGMHPIPIVHGMTLGELALMINDKGWLEGGIKCRLGVIKCEGYSHKSRYTLPIKPSPNLPNMRSIYLYSSLCYFEGTPVSLGRGTDYPFQVYGHPKLTKYLFSFTPRSISGAANPPLKETKCYGVDLRTEPSDEEILKTGINLSYIIDCYNIIGGGEKFFTPMFNLLTGVDYIRTMIIEGHSAPEICAKWSGDVAQFRVERKPYLLYEE